MLMVILVWALASGGGNIGANSRIKASPSGTHAVLRKASSLTNKFVAPEKKWHFGISSYSRRASTLGGSNHPTPALLYIRGLVFFLVVEAEKLVVWRRSALPGASALVEAPAQT
jgi:hypothetical protein